VAPINRDSFIRHSDSALPFRTGQNGAGGGWGSRYGGELAVLIGDDLFFAFKNQYRNARQELVTLHHSSFSRGQPVRFAGHIEWREGIPEILTTKTGHYHSPNEAAVEMLLWLKQKQVPLPSKVHVYAPGGVTAQYTVGPEGTSVVYECNSEVALVEKAGNWMRTADFLQAVTHSESALGTKSAETLAQLVAQEALEKQKMLQALAALYP
jgi:hypothetical protein